MAFISRRRVLRCDGLLRRCKAVSICSAITGRGRRDEWRRRSVGHTADSGPRGELYAQPAPPNAIWGAFRERVEMLVDRVRDGEMKNREAT
jgi:hypothetical protein